MLEEVRLSYSPFHNRISGHVSLVFKFIDGKEVVISPEAKTDKFSMILGFLMYYRMHYKVFDYGSYQARLMKKRRSSRELKLPLTKEQMQQLFDHMQIRAQELQQKIERYHVFYNSCITNTFMHLKHVTNIDVGFVNKVLALNPYQTTIKYYIAGNTTQLQ